MNTKVWTLAKAERAANYMNAMHGAATLTAIEMVCTLYNTTHTHTHTHTHSHKYGIQVASAAAVSKAGAPPSAAPQPFVCLRDGASEASGSASEAGWSSCGVTGTIEVAFGAPGTGSLVLKPRVLSIPSHRGNLGETSETDGSEVLARQAHVIVGVRDSKGRLVAQATVVKLQ